MRGGGETLQPIEGKMCVRAPCKNCENRTEYCHSKCKAYKEFRAFRDRLLEQRKNEHIVIETSIEGVSRTAKSRGIGKLRRKRT